MANPMYGQNKFDNAVDEEIKLPVSLKGLEQTSLSTSGTVTYKYGININNFTGAAAQAGTLPAAKRGQIVIHQQSVDTTGGTSTCTFDCAGTDVYAAGSVVESRNSNAVVFDTSVVDETLLTYTPANATTNLITIGSKIIFYCIEDGIWEVRCEFGQDPLAVTGALAFGS
tara:strand:+ start:338 stop:847 length:510 start_codon:yes stop_codon:yes gene_type:complete